MTEWTDWTAEQLLAWRGSLGWTQKQAAKALFFHVQSYKKLERSTRRIMPYLKRFGLLLEREHIRALRTLSGPPGRLQVFATPQRVTSRVAAMAQNGLLHDAQGNPRVRYVSLFAGVEAATAALERIGADAVPIAFSEIDAAANAVLHHRWLDVPRVGDICHFDWSELRGQVDLVVGGPPCQSFSVAGRRLGLTDPRDKLALHMLRAVEAMQPKWVLLENVPGLLSANKGNDFTILCDTLEELGFSFAWAVLDAANFGLPQTRHRLWLVGERSGEARGPESVLDLSKGPGWAALQGLSAWKNPARRAAEGPGTVTEEPEVDWSEADAWSGVDIPREGHAISGSRSLGSRHSIKARRIANKAADLASPPASPGEDLAEGAESISFAASMRHGTVNIIAPTIMTRANSLNSNPCVLLLKDGKPALRRFTPREVLRLQGFDDDWLDGPTLGGKPLSDTDRYRLTGNSWPIPVAAWILERLLHVMKRGA